MADLASQMTRAQYAERVSKAADVYKSPKRERFIATRMQQFDEARLAAVREQIEKERSFITGAAKYGPWASGAASNLMSAGAAAAGGLDAASLGYAAPLAGVISPKAGAMLETDRQVAQEEHPLAFTAGQLGGFAHPNTAASRVAQAGGRAATQVFAPLERAMMRGAAATPGARRLTSQSLRESLAARTMSRIVENTVSGAGATTAVEAARHREEPAMLQARLLDALDALNPTTTSGMVEAGVNIAGGLATGPFNLRIAPHLQRAVRNWERRSGRRLPVDTITDRASLQQWYDTIGKSPWGANLAREVARDVHEGNIRNLRAMAAERGVGLTQELKQTERARDRAGRAVRRLQGEGRTPGLITARRRGTFAAIDAAEGTNRLDVLANDQLREHLLDVRKDVIGRAGGENTLDGKQAREFLDEVLKLFEPEPTGLLGADGKPTYRPAPPLTLQNLETIRGSLGRYVEELPGSAVGGLDRRGFERAYLAVRQAFQNVSPDWDAHIELAANELRRTERALGQDKVLDRLSEGQLQQFWNNPARLREWRAVRQELPAEDQNAIRGWLLASFFEKVATTEGAITPKTMRKVMTEQEDSMFSRRVMREVFGPKLLQDLKDHAAITASFQRGIGKAAGSETAPRALTAAAIPAAIAALTTFAHSVSTGEYNLLLNTLQGAGAAAFVNGVQKSMIRGLAQDRMQRIVREGPGHPLARPQAAVGWVMGDEKKRNRYLELRAQPE